MAPSLFTIISRWQGRTKGADRVRPPGDFGYNFLFVVKEAFSEKNSGLNLMSLWVLEGDYSVALQRPAIVKTGTTVCTLLSTRPEASRGFVY